MTSRRLALAAMASVLALASAAPTALAGGPPMLDLVFDAAGDGAGETAYNWEWYGDAPVYGKYMVDGQSFTGWSYDAGDTMPGAWDLSWQVVFSSQQTSAGSSPGAFVVANIVVTNNNVFSDTFSTQLVVPLDQPIFDPLMRGSVSGTLTELTFNTASVSAQPGGQIYTPRIDGFDETDGFLLADPFTQTAGALQQAPVGPESFGMMTPIAASRDAANSIAILLDFELSPGDSVALNAYFELMPVPGPAGLPTLALLTLLGRRRRR